MADEASPRFRAGVWRTKTNPASCPGYRLPACLPREFDMKSSSSIGCQDFLQMRMSRRRLLQIGGLGFGGLTLAQLLHAEAQTKQSSSKATARSVILLFQF